VQRTQDLRHLIVDAGEEAGRARVGEQRCEQIDVRDDDVEQDEQDERTSAA
jgi:hypothetical protein